MATKKKSSEQPEVEVTDAVTGEEVKTDDSPYASGTVSASALKIGARDNDHVRRLQHALGKVRPGQVLVTGNYQARTAGLVADVLGEGDGRSLTKTQAKKVLGSGYEVTE